MTILPFAAQFMKVGVLTAALRELTPRHVRDADSARAIEDWLELGRDARADVLQLSAALHSRKLDFMRRVLGAAVLLGVPAVWVHRPRPDEEN